MVSQGANELNDFWPALQASISWSLISISLLSGKKYQVR